MAKIKKDDLVVVIAGKDRGQQGRVLVVDTEHDRVIVEGINRVQRHIKANTRRDNQAGGIVTIEAPVHISNVMLVDPQSKKGTRVGYRTEEVERDGRKRTVRVRVAKRSGKDV
jgi:large subunit ribosomal protein L24